MQKPLAPQTAGQEPGGEQLARHAPAPSQLVLPHPFSGSAPAGLGVQVPALPLSAHDTHAPTQAVSQHTPSAQKPEAHSQPLAQVPEARLATHAPALHQLDAALHSLPQAWAQVVRQAPAPSQVYAPQPFSGSLAAACGVQVPSAPGWLHEAQALPQLELQHTPSTQLPVPHWLPLVHEAPRPNPATQAPLTQVFEAAQSELPLQ